MIIDVHGHVLGPGYPVGSEFSTTAEKTREVLHRHNVGQIWMSHTSAMVLDDSVCNRQLYEEYVKVYPDTFVGFFMMVPLPMQIRPRSRIWLRSIPMSM